ncbi:hypothetical protein F4809DRAFT_568482 [Biscogniauxia mediterranea]|nr:hypothetical protein F4809DRAFT_568482 [Biscogniauxia mediterranea]
MKFSAATLFISTASAGLLRRGQAGLPLEHFGKVPSVTPEEAKVGLDVLKTTTNILGARSEGLPLDTFGQVHHVTPEEALAKLDLGGNNFTLLPVSGAIDKLVTSIEQKIESALHPRDDGDCANPNIRFEWDDYSASDKDAFVSAIQCLVQRPASGRFSPARNRYEDFVRLHQTYAPNIHSKSTQQQTHKFLLWHRYFVWAFEQVLRDECGFNRAFPWWDEKKWAGRFSQATIFTSQYFGSLPGSTNNAATCINDGKFGGMSLSLGPGYATDNPHCLQRAVNEGTTAQTGVDAWNTCFSRTTYPDFHSCVEFTYHAQGHNGVGGIMADAIGSAGDPAFFMHHLYIDYAFRKWQIEDISRRTTISGCADNVNCSPLTLDTMVYMGQICGDKCPDLKVRDILSTLKGHFCYRYNY